MRAFFALDLPEPARNLARDLQVELKKTGVAASFPRPDALHVTLHFLGEIEEGMRTRLESLLDEAARSTPEFAVTLGGVGAFPDVRRPRVIWLGVRADAGLFFVHQTLGMGLERLGVELEARPFHPHVTLARVKQSPRARLEPFFAQSSAECAFEAESVTLYESRRGPSGARYHALARSRLGTGSISCE